MKYRLLTIAACLIVTASMLLIPIDAGTPADIAEPVPACYPRAAVIVDIDPEADTVTAEDCVGLCWSFYGAEDWIVGDCCSLLMDTNGTPETILDDLVIAAYYESWTFTH